MPKNPPLHTPSNVGTEINLPYNLTLRNYQQPVWNYMMQSRKGLRACAIWPRRNGKDLICLNIVIAKAIQRRGLYLYIAPFQTQTRLIIWMGMTSEGIKFLDYIPPELVANKWESRMEIELINGSIIKLIGADNFDSKMGAGAMGAVFTEYSLQKPDAWNYIRPMFVENGGWAMFNYTARGLNHGYALAKMAKDNPKWFYQYLTCVDTGYPTLDLIQEERESGMKESLIQQEYYNDWNASTEETFLPLDLVAPCFEGEDIPYEEYKNEPIIFGCDVAYAANGDKATIGCRQGRKIHFLRWYQGRNNMAFAREIQRFAKIWHPDAINIDAGRGEGVISKLEDLHMDHLVFPIHFGGKVYEEAYSNMKGLMWGRMLDWFLAIKKPDFTGLDDNKYANEPVAEQLLYELCLPFMVKDDKNKIAVESKKALKTRGEDSPDLAETIGLTFAEEVEKDNSYTTDDQVRRTEYTPKHTYEPLGYMDRMENEQSSFY